MNYTHLEEYYKGKKIFITGHTGFKGSWMTAWLNGLGADVKGYALAPLTDNDLFVTMGGDSMCQSIIADVRDSSRLEQEIVLFQPDIIFHLAAQPLVRFSYDYPLETFDVNIMGTANLLNATRKISKRCNVVVITTDKVYDNKEWHYPYRETDRLGGYDPYSASKGCAELVVSSYRNSFFNKKEFDNHQKSIATARAGNVIGGGDWAVDRIIPDIARALMANEKIEVRNPIAVRPWQHVLESIGGYLHLGSQMMKQPLDFGESWNFGPFAEDNISVRELVAKAIAQWGDGEANYHELVKGHHEAVLLKLDISKTMNHLKWRPKLNSTEAIQKTIDWYKRSLIEETRTLVLEDIKSFTKS